MLCETHDLAEATACAYAAAALQARAEQMERVLEGRAIEIRTQREAIDGMMAHQAGFQAYREGKLDNLQPYASPALNSQWFQGYAVAKGMFAHLEARVEAFRKINKELGGALRAGQDELGTLRGRVRELERQLASLVREADDVCDQLSHVEAQYENMSRHADDLKTELCKQYERGDRAEAMVEKLQEALRNSTLLLKSLLGIEANCEGALDEQVRENKAALAASAGSGTEARLC